MRERKKSELNMPPPAQLMLSDKEVAAMLGLGVSTIWKKNKRSVKRISKAIQHHRSSPALEKVRHPQMGQGTQPRQGRTTSLEAETPPKWRGFILSANLANEKQTQTLIAQHIPTLFDYK